MDETVWLGYSSHAVCLACKLKKPSKTEQNWENLAFFQIKEGLAKETCLYMTS